MPGSAYYSAVSFFISLNPSQFVDVKPSPNGIAITHRKKTAPSRAVRAAYSTTTIGSRTGPRRALGIAAQAAKRNYRPDLRAVSICASLSSFHFRFFLLFEMSHSR